MSTLQYVLHITELANIIVMQCFPQRIFQLEARDMPHEFIYLDEAGFNLTRRRRRGRNIIGQRAIVQVPGQRGGNITICAAISNHGVLHHHVTMGAYNTQHLMTFLANLRNNLLELENHEDTMYVIVWDNVSFHRAMQIQEWINLNNAQFLNLFLPPYSPFLNPIEEFFSSWRWKVYDRQPYTRVDLIEAMDLACGDIGEEQCQGWIRHSRRFFTRCLERENIACDVDEVLWPNPVERHDEA